MVIMNNRDCHFPKLLIIGAGIGQVPLLQKAKAKGIHVTVASIPGPYPCFPLADDIIYMDIYDREGIAEEARKRNIGAVISDQNDLTNPTVAYVAEKLGLPGNKFDTVMAYCNKNRFRKLCEKAGVPVPCHREIHDASEGMDFDYPLPWIVKPADSQSSIGVQRIDRKEKLKDALETALQRSPTHSAILEEFFTGLEVVCEGYIENGKYYLLAFADRKYFNLPDLLIPCQTIFPSVFDPKLLDQIIRYEQALATEANPSFAIVHAEYLINPLTGQIRMVESALRGGGVYISSDLIPMATGIDIDEVLLDKALGKTVDTEKVFAGRNDKASAYICFHLLEGIITAVEGAEELNNLPFVEKAYLKDIRIGEKTEKMTYKGARKGPILLWGKNRDELERNIAIVRQTLKISVQQPDGKTAGILWD